MSEFAPEPPSGGGGNNPLTTKIMGMPGWVVLLGAVVIGYFLLSRKSSTAGGTSSGGGGTSTTGDITIQPGTTTVNVTSALTPSQTVAYPPPPRHRVPNPQPVIPPPIVSPPPVVSVPVNHPRKPKPHPAQTSYTTVTVAKWPGQSNGGLAQWNTTLWGIAKHTGTTVPELAKLNGIKNPSLIYPGQKIKVPKKVTAK